MQVGIKIKETIINGSIGEVNFVNNQGIVGISWENGWQEKQTLSWLRDEIDSKDLILLIPILNN